LTFINQHIDTIRELCRSHKVKELYAFGSVVDEAKFTEKSDVDLIVKFSDHVAVEDYADLYFDLVHKFETVLKRRVDLMTYKPIRNKYLRESIDASKMKIYEA
jgi:predicted nucleotidyltransferase